MDFKTIGSVRAELILLAAFSLIAVGLIRATFDHVTDTQSALVTENARLRAQVESLRYVVQRNDDSLRKWNFAQADSAFNQHKEVTDLVLSVKRDLTNMQVRHRPFSQ